MVGEIIVGANGVRPKIILNEYGQIATDCWQEIPKHFPGVDIDEFVAMPNHVHGIIIINADCRGEVTSPLRRKYTLGQIVAYFKYQSTKQINQIRGGPGIRICQRNYYEHIFRNEKELNQIREYIQSNPFKWHLDRENPLRTGIEPLEGVGATGRSPLQLGTIKFFYFFYNIILLRGG